MSVKIEILDYVYTDNTNTVIDWDNSVVGELDVTDHSDFPLAMTFQISDIKDLTSTSGNYSKTFKIPATNNNNKLLKNPYIANIDTEVSITENKKCRILVNNLFSVVGLIKITGVVGYGETPSHYDCVFFGNNLSWAYDLSNLYIHELDWGTNSEGLEYNQTKIMATWQNVDCDAATAASDPPIVYPVTSYGDYNPDGEPRTIQLLSVFANYSLTYNGYNFAGDSYGTPKPSSDWRPAVFIKDTLEKIFSKVGYSLNSTFMNTSMFKKLVWLLPNFKYNNPEERYSQYSAEATFDTSVALSKFEIDKIWASSSAAYTPEYGNNNIDLGTINTNFTLSSDTSSTQITYANGTGEFTIAEYGYYDIKASGFSAQLSNLLQDGAVPATQYNINQVRFSEITIDRVKFILQLKTAGQTTWNNICAAEDTTATTFVGSLGAHGVSGIKLIDATNSYNWNVSDSINDEGYWLNKGDKLRISFFAKFSPHTDGGSSSWIGSGDWSFDVIPTISNFDISLNSKVVSYGQTYDLKDVINKDYKSLDFVKGVAHAFNLKMTTDETTKTVNIEPFDSFYKDYAEAIDWTYKLDRSKQIDDKWIKSDLKRDVLFKFKTDSEDKKVEMRGEEWFNGIKDEYPYQETLPKTFEKGESKYENPFFAGTHSTKDRDSSSGNNSLLAYSACLWKENAYGFQDYRPNKGFDFLPRLLYWNKYSPPSVGLPYWINFAKVQIWANQFKFLLADASSSSVNLISNIYPQATSVNRDKTSSPILSYGNVNVRNFDDATGAYTSFAAGKGLFETYYKSMFEMLKAKPRLRIVYVDLKVADIVNLDFTKLIYIDGVYWRVNKVVDYQPNKNESTKVELIEWISLGVFAATSPPFGGNDNTGSLDADIGTEDDNQNIGL